ncbi:hypothetical protein MTO96_001095 [Rhipicephalus appendiculatus]
MGKSLQEKKHEDKVAVNRILKLRLTLLNVYKILLSILLEKVSSFHKENNVVRQRQATMFMNACTYNTKSTSYVTLWSSKVNTVMEVFTTTLSSSSPLVCYSWYLSL